VNAAAPARADALAMTGDDAAWTLEARAQLRSCDEAAALAFDTRVVRLTRDANDDAIDAVLLTRGGCVDDVVRAAWRRSGCAQPGLALFAVGGYGRGELFPHSDVDLLVVADVAGQAAFAPALSRFFALLWDAGLKTGHAVRSLAECTEAARGEITIFTAMLEARQLAGDAQVAIGLQDAIAAPIVWPAAGYFAAKREEQVQRHARFNDTAYNLEPNLKEGPGGLRDLHTLAWMARRVHGANGLGALVPLGLLGEDEYATLELERRALSRLRFGLHLVAGRAEERLLFDHQKALAARLGFLDEHQDNLAVEQMMQGFFRSAARVLRINERLLQRFEEQLEGVAEPVSLDGEFIALHGYLAFVDSAPPDASRCLRLFAAWATHPELRGLHSESARALAEALPRIPSYVDAPPSLRAQFVDLLRMPNAVDALARMARLGVLGRYLPDFGRVSGRMQYDLFHVFTVDAHTLAVLRNMQGFADGANADRFTLAADVFPRLRKPELLLLAGLFHDIAKGRGGDHSELGAADALAFCDAHLLPPADSELVSWLVLKHLLMSLTAQKQDIADPVVVNRFADAVADRERLDYLYLLTCADIAGTSPKLWNGWKDRLLGDLYTATRFALRRGIEHPVHAAERVAETRAEAHSMLNDSGLYDEQIESVWALFPEESFLRYRPQQIAWQTQAIVAQGALDSRSSASNALVAARELDGAGAMEVFVCAPDRDGLFAAAVATLDRLGLDILEARALGRDGMVFDGFQVLPVRSRHTPSPEHVMQTMREALVDPEAVRPARRALPRQLRHFRIPAQIEFVPAPQFSRMTLIAGDRPGLLADVALVLRDQHLRVHDARIATFGERVEDFFVISDANDHALDETAQQALREALIARIDGDMT
jgi:[protein-PII] uridylyltransferase